MATIKVADFAWGRLRAPDLDRMEEFLIHYGFVRAERTNNTLYMRGSDPTHHIHITEKGEPRFVGLAYYAKNEDDLKRVAKAPGASAIVPRPLTPCINLRAPLIATGAAAAAPAPASTPFAPDSGPPPFVPRPL